METTNTWKDIPYITFLSIVPNSALLPSDMERAPGGLEFYNKDIRNFGFGLQICFEPGDKAVQVTAKSNEFENWGEESPFEGKRFPTYLPERILRAVDSGDLFVRLLTGEQIILARKQTPFKGISTFEEMLNKVTK